MELTNEPTRLTTGKTPREALKEIVDSDKFTLSEIIDELQRCYRARATRKHDTKAFSRANALRRVGQNLRERKED